MQTVEAKQQERIWRSRASTAEATLQQMQQDMAEIVADMKRQHEAALQATQQRMQQLEAREAELLRLMEGKEAAVKELAAKHSETCKDRDIQVCRPHLPDVWDISPYPFHVAVACKPAAVLSLRSSQSVNSKG
jgi:hypothetical protein